MSEEDHEDVLKAVILEDIHDALVEIFLRISWEIIFDFLIFQFSDKFWEIFQISSESSRVSPKITE